MGQAEVLAGWWLRRSEGLTASDRHVRGAFDGKIQGSFTAFRMTA
jgi:hypothetical protein